MVCSLLSKASCSNICYLELKKATSKSMLTSRVFINHRLLHSFVIVSLHKIAFSFAPTGTQTMVYMFKLSTTVFIHA